MKPEVLLYLHILLQHEGRCDETDLYYYDNKIQSLPCDDCPLNCRKDAELTAVRGDESIYFPMKVKKAQEFLDTATEQDFIELYKVCV